MYQTARISLAASVAILLAACSSAEKTPPVDSTAAPVTSAPGVAAAAAAVTIVSPAEGDTITLPYTLKLSVTAVEVVAANGKREDGKGHHHLVIDGDAPSTDSLPLAAAPVVIHMGNGATERVLDSLAVGPHRVIAIFASGDHVPWTSVARDTVHFVVKR